MNRKLLYGKYGLKENPLNYIVTMEYKGKSLLGNVKRCFRDETIGCIMLDVYHFCGDEWPVNPVRALAVDVLL